MKSDLEMNVSVLRISGKLISKLLSNDIDTFFKLCNFSRLELTRLNFSSSEINEIIIALQLRGVDLKKNHAKKNMSVYNLD